MADIIRNDWEIVREGGRGNKDRPEKKMLFRKLILFLNLVVTTFCCNGQTGVRFVSGELVFSNKPFAQCHASTIVETSPGRFLVAAFGGTGEGNKDVCIWLSEYESGEWSSPVMIADGVADDSIRYPCWNPVLFMNRKGRLFLFYKAGPSPQKWWGMVKHSDNQGKSWSRSERLPDGILGPVKNKPVELPDGSVLSGSSTETGGDWKIDAERSADGGNTWLEIPIDPKTAFQVIQPAILVSGEKKILMLCRSKNNFIAETTSSDAGKSWSTIKLTALPNPDSGIDALTLADGRDLLVYNPQKKGGEGRARLAVAISKDGLNWNQVLVLESEKKGEFSYPAVIQSSDGKIHITYTYNRVNIKHVVLEGI
ncbi:MAG TPA: sialidase family protein [Bacteroidales bacterium]|nr:sialidase family protein [Bacteroidales bacterium]